MVWALNVRQEKDRLPSHQMLVHLCTIDQNHMNTYKRMNKINSKEFSGYKNMTSFRCEVG